GMIIKANPFYFHSQKSPFGFTALSALLVSNKELEQVEKKTEENLKSLEENFLDLNLLNITQIQKINEYLITETLYEVLQWKSGEYEFIVGEIKYDPRFFPLIPPEHILLDVLRMIDEAPELSRRIPSAETVFQKISLEEEKIKQLEESDINKKMVYSLIDGIKTVQEISFQSLLGRYQTLKAIVTLSENQLIRKKGIKKVSSFKPLAFQNRIEYIFYGVLPIIIVLFFIGLRFLFALNLPSGDFKTAYEKVFIQNRLQKIQTALNIYFFKKGKYPFTLLDLVNEGLVSPEEIKSLRRLSMSINHSKIGPNTELPSFINSPNDFIWK
ncbi:MAG: DUF4388 domain-containing protein, partial [Desulfobacterota bacterium]|nr:DUF4388 domain-containing protein [Thermodesulfobacteriota bacterium]